MRLREEQVAVGIFGTLGALFIVAWIALGLTLMVLPYWAVGSLVTSAVKADAKECGQRYEIEDYLINGDWFCPKDGRP